MVKFLAWFVACAMSTFGFSYLYYKFLKCNRVSFKVCVVFMIGTLLITFIKYLKIRIINSFFFFIYYPILFYFMKPLPIKKLLYYVLIIWFIGVGLDLLAMLFVSYLYNTFAFNFFNNLMLASICLSFIVFLGLIIISKINKISIFFDKLFNQLVKIRYSDLLIIFIMTYIFISASVILINLPNLTVDILLCLLIFLVIMVFGFLLKSKVDENEIAKYLKVLNANNQFYITMDDENRIFKHNLIAKLLAIKSVSGKKARELIDDYILSFNNSMDFSVKIKDMPYGLNGVIYEKLYPSIGSLDIKIDNKINFDIFQKIKPRRYNVFVEKLIIALDNAIEASLTSVDKILVINLYSEDGNIIADIKNSFATDLNLDKLGSIHYSTKDKKKRGLGLFSALRDNEVNMKIKIINNLFVTKIVAKQNINE